LGANRSKDLLASLAVHAALAGVVAVAVVLHPVRRSEPPVTFEVVRVPATRTSALPPLAPTQAAPAASASASVPAVVRRSAPSVATPSHVAVHAPVVDPDAVADVPGDPLGQGVGSAADVSFAPPAPPSPPPAPREVTRAEADATFVDSGYVRLETLVIDWQHNDDVRGCIEHQLGTGERLAEASQSARGRMLDAVRRGDHDAALAEARRLHDAASSFDALYRRARHCLE
jgi:hypothetical protein